MEGSPHILQQSLGSLFRILVYKRTVKSERSMSYEGSMVREDGESVGHCPGENDQPRDMCGVSYKFSVGNGSEGISLA